MDKSVTIGVQKLTNDWTWKVTKKLSETVALLLRPRRAILMYTPVEFSILTTKNFKPENGNENVHWFVRQSPFPNL